SSSTRAAVNPSRPLSVTNHREPAAITCNPGEPLLSGVHHRQAIVVRAAAAPPSPASLLTPLSIVRPSAVVSGAFSVIARSQQAASIAKLAAPPAVIVSPDERTPGLRTTRLGHHFVRRRVLIPRTVPKYDSIFVF
ncbi:Unknown protein, partial [Striga hermonthica]